MTRDEQLVYCKKCTNRKMDLQQGLLCAITSEKANFDVSCADFSEDQTYVPEPTYTETVGNPENNISVPVELLEKLKLEQNLPLATFAGIGAGIIGAIIWGMITLATNYQIGYLAIALGAGVGYSMRYLGKGIDQVFGLVGGFLAVASCFLGNFLSVIGFIANAEGLDYIETLFLFDYAYFVPVMSETFSMMDLFFYAIAGYEGYKFSFRTLTEEDLERLKVRA